MIICLFVYSVIQEINLFTQQGRFKLIKKWQKSIFGLQNIYIANKCYSFELS